MRQLTQPPVSAALALSGGAYLVRRLLENGANSSFVNQVVDDVRNEVNRIRTFPQDSEKPVMILAVGHPSEDATVPKVAKIKKPLDEILSVWD